MPKTFTDSSGRPNGAVFGFTSMLLKVIEDLRPDYLAVGFDEKGPTFRHAEYLTYKEGRPEMDSELSTQIPQVKKLLDELEIPHFSVEGYEGEDVVAALNMQAGETCPELLTYLVTGDMDLLQLVDENTFAYTPKKGLSEAKIYDSAAVVERFGIKPEQVTDYKGLRGDPSDRIPGVRGIGEKTAAALLQEYGSLEEVYRNIDKISPSIARKLAEDAEMAALSKKLATIVTDVPLRLDLEACRLEAQTSKMASVLRRHSFPSLAARLQKNQPQEDLTLGL